MQKGANGVIEITKPEILQMFPPKENQACPLCIDLAIISNCSDPNPIIAGLTDLIPKNHHCFRSHLPHQNTLLPFWSRSMMGLCGRILSRYLLSIRDPETKFVPRFLCFENDYRKNNKGNAPIEPQMIHTMVKVVEDQVTKMGHQAIKLNGEIVLTDGRVAQRDTFYIAITPNMH
jgi:hypothetical protein